MPEKFEKQNVCVQFSFPTLVCTAVLLRKYWGLGHRKVPERSVSQGMLP